MTSEPSAEPRTSTLGPFACTTAGNAFDIAQTVIGKHGVSLVLGSFERDLERILRLSGVPVESTRVIVPQTIHCARAVLRAVLGSFILDISTPPTEPLKQPSTPTLES